MSMGTGCIQGGPTKQKINTTSSTAAELVAVNDRMPNILWTNYFLEAQGYPVKTTVKQDNKSAILLENNGKRSSRKGTKHINVRYFFVTDRVANGELSIEYCPTGEMIADFFTKPLQGKLFVKMRDLVMGLPIKAIVDPEEKVNMFAPRQSESPRSTGVCWDKNIPDNHREGKTSLRRVRRVTSRTSILRTVGARYSGRIRVQ